MRTESYGYMSIPALATGRKERKATKYMFDLELELQGLAFVNRILISLMRDGNNDLIKIRIAKNMKAGCVIFQQQRRIIHSIAKFIRHIIALF